MSWPLELCATHGCQAENEVKTLSIDPDEAEDQALQLVEMHPSRRDWRERVGMRCMLPCAKSVGLVCVAALVFVVGPSTYTLARDLCVQPGFYAPDLHYSIQQWADAVKKHVQSNDHVLFKKVVGNSIEDLLHDDFWNQASEAELNVLHNAPSQKFVPHPMNEKGMHVLRALLSERSVDFLRVKRKSSRHELYQRFMRDGVLAIPIENVSIEAARLQASGAGPSEIFKDAAARGKIEDLLGSISGYKDVGVERFSSWVTLTHVAGDRQYYMHVDTVQPTWKVWIFAPNTRIEHGPFHFVYGSHRTTEGKMRWLYDTSSQLLSCEDMHPVDVTEPDGPFNHSRNSIGTSLRVDGFDPKRWSPLIAAAFAEYGFPKPTPITTGESWTLVVADTSGFHYRGYAEPGQRRTQSNMVWSNWFPTGCPDCLPRKHPFYCTETPLPSDC